MNPIKATASLVPLIVDGAATVPALVTGGVGMSRARDVSMLTGWSRAGIFTIEDSMMVVRAGGACESRSCLPAR